MRILDASTSSDDRTIVNDDINRHFSKFCFRIFSYATNILYLEYQNKTTYSKDNQ